MPLPVGKAHHPVLDEGAIAGAGALDEAEKPGIFLHVRLYRRMGLGVGSGEVTGVPIVNPPRVVKGKRKWFPGALLGDQRPPVHRIAVDPGGRAGLQPPHLKTLTPQVISQLGGAHLPQGAGRKRSHPQKDLSPQVGSRSQNHPGRDDDLLGAQPHPSHPLAVAFQGLHVPLKGLQRRTGLQDVFHMGVIAPQVTLGPKGAHRRPLGGVEPPEMERRGICGPGLLPPQGVHLPNQMTLGGPPHGGVTGHEGYIIGI